MAGHTIGKMRSGLEELKMFGNYSLNVLNTPPPAGILFLCCDGHTKILKIWACSIKFKFFWDMSLIASITNC